MTGREAHARLAAMSLELQDHLPAVFPSHPIWLLMVNNMNIIIYMVIYH